MRLFVRSHRFATHSTLVSLLAVLTGFTVLFAATASSGVRRAPNTAVVGAESGDLAPHLLAPEQVEAITAEEFTEVLAAHKGKVVLVNLWATWCIPCVRELPDIDLLQQRYRDQGLVVLAVSFDKPANLESRVRSFFAKTAPNLISYLQTEEQDYDFVSTLDPDWIGGLPTSFFIARNGKITASFTGQMKYQDMEKKVLDLLKESPE